MEWFNEPKKWQAQPGGAIELTTDPGTDFWQKTHYGFQRDNGHFYYQQVAGDFQAEVKISGVYKDLYDHAGLMVRIDAANWLKCGIEFVEGVQYVSAVYTREYSDWSVTPLTESPAALFLRVKREKETFEVHYSLDGEKYSMLRLGYLAADGPVMVGIMAGAPDGSGFPVRFENFAITIKETP